jgi:hypothetical protein
MNHNLAATFPPPVMEARRWIDGRELSRPTDRSSISARPRPVAPPPEPLARAMAEALIENPASHLYGPVLGLPELRAELAQPMVGGLRRHHHACAGRRDRRLQPGFLRRHGHHRGSRATR